MTTKNKKIRAKSAIRKITDPISFGEMLQAYRKTNEHTQVEMAEILGISKQDLCNIEKGRKIASQERAISFANALGLPKKLLLNMRFKISFTRPVLMGKSRLMKSPKFPFSYNKSYTNQSDNNVF